MKSTLDIVVVDIDKLIPAPWNYKADMSDEQLAKLKRSIERDKSAGVPCVREMKAGTFEVIDGNHRLEALRALGWKKVTVENFGKLTVADAVVVARRRNKEWAEDDALKLAQLMSSEVIPKIPIEELEAFMPETIEQLQNYDAIADFDWSDPELKEHGDKKGTRVVLVLSEELAEQFQEKIDQIKTQLGSSGDSAAIAAVLQVLKDVPLEAYE